MVRDVRGARNAQSSVTSSAIVSLILIGRIRSTTNSAVPPSALPAQALDLAGPKAQ